MTEEEKESVTEQVATAHDGVNAEVANQQSTDESDKKEFNFRRLEESRDKANERASYAEQQAAILKDRLDRLEAQGQEKQPEKDPDDFVSNREYHQDISKREQAMAQRLMKLEAKAENPDLDKVINKYGKKLSRAVADACLRAPNPYLAAYEACKTSESYYRDQLETTQHDHARRAEANAKKPNNPDKVGAKGALGHAKDYQKLTNAELLAMGDRYRLG